MEEPKEQLQDFLSRLLKQAKLDLKFQIRSNDAASGDPDAPQIIVEFSGADTDLLLMRGGELLEALEDVSQRLLRLPSMERSTLSFDCMDYRSLRLEELRLTAATAAETVQRTGALFSLNPMNSRERRIIHLSLKENSAVRTESQGAGSHRRVVILPAESK